MWWHVLGVHPDASTADIKSAYSRLIKTYRPDTDPEKFSEIREAYEQARKPQRPTRSSTNHQFRSVENPQDQGEHFQFSQQGSEDTRASSAESPSETGKKELEGSLRSVGETPYQQVMGLLKEWKEGQFREWSSVNRIVTHDALNDYAVFKRLESDILVWLHNELQVKQGFLRRKANISAEMLSKLDEIFGWSSNEQQLCRQYEDLDLSVFFALVNEGNKNWNYVNPLIAQSPVVADQGKPSRSRAFLGALLHLTIISFTVVVFLGTEKILSAVIFFGLSYLVIETLLDFSASKWLFLVATSGSSKFSVFVACFLLFFKYGFIAAMLLIVSLLPIAAAVALLFVLGLFIYEIVIGEGSYAGNRIVGLIFSIGLAVFFTIYIDKRILAYARLKYSEALLEIRRIKSRSGS